MRTQQPRGKKKVKGLLGEGLKKKPGSWEHRRGKGKSEQAWERGKRLERKWKLLVPTTTTAKREPSRERIGENSW